MAKLQYTSYNSALDHLLLIRKSYSAYGNFVNLFVSLLF